MTIQKRKLAMTVARKYPTMPRSHRRNIWQAQRRRAASFSSNYAQLLLSYMAHIVECEGTDFLEYAEYRFSKPDLENLKGIAALIYTEEDEETAVMTDFFGSMRVEAD